ncbi:hypothetical protein [Yersinia pseudotuberculosis]|uniref:Uncharacterized protein n=1 Tax=Yersinia pseudotuberculosis TaxID=633 RepID=A0ABM7ADB9_YERPU|nr:hypothetical protein [Yersinia pseudotuberculosis]AJJ08664.1 hypothetical protein BZ20_1381 [Yersinia pseudotuberculosis]AYW90452.1 hypothetical protein EGX47_03280 [Yersinia pseudotuberculosis]AYX11500.1 hypothetical protein EGX52_12400 [Yersinia pseudotuberculosis]MBO1563341.1 hypothetical protein [Yersinia pseudotuberculosis]MBO1565278.1 hypothetical protein [Yersinia pseudotuberculosis]
MIRYIVLTITAMLSISSYGSDEYFCKTVMMTDHTIRETVKDKSWNGILKVTDYGNRFIVHFNGHYGMSDFDSDEIRALDKNRYLNIKKEDDGSITFYRKERNSYTVSNSVNNKDRFELILYSCHQSKKD